MMRALVVLLIVATSGCATVNTKPGAKANEKLADDVLALKKMADDVKAQCGDEFASIAPIVGSAIAIAANPTDALAIIVAAAQATPALIADVKALACVVKVITADLKALKPTAANERAIANAEGVLAQLAYDESPSQLLCSAQ